MRTERRLVRKYGESAALLLDFAAGIVFAISVVSFHPSPQDEANEGSEIDYVVSELEKARTYGIVGVVLLMLSFVVKVLYADVHKKRP
jgi:Ni/Fe-hydrogenase subunit HybB-like protein